ncbi:hypothetical protein DEU56DRAFT_756330 [Suillus clintonianus]|uniref:uncharacterized protein n=1 Tax=Suillus clintonianus TaxID=1904413 RepID=UPI001B87807E|nr:uncharacterized protein DEU56DRAFT_756330 [Suillus clintonianus]KAG2136422.1 hypothetical protein DEU56DRAFT_756330 [Suillus clintonianus]
MSHHTRVTHTPVTNINVPGGQKLTRQADNHFHCHLCNFVNNDPLKLRTHYSRGHPESSEGDGSARDIGADQDVSPDLDESENYNRGTPPISSPPIQLRSSAGPSKKRKRKRKAAPTDEAADLLNATGEGSAPHPTAVQNDAPPAFDSSSGPVDLTLLHKISFTVDPVYKLAICIDCECAVPAAHVRAHAVKQHSLRPPPSEQLDAILHFLRVFHVRYRGVITLPAKDKTMQEHFQFNHPDKQWRPNTAERNLQRIFEFRGRQSLVMVDISLIPSSTTNYDNYMTNVTKHRPAVDSDIYHVDSDTRSHGTFLAKMRWNQAIEGLPLPELLKAASAPGEQEPLLPDPAYSPPSSFPFQLLLTEAQTDSLQELLSLLKGLTRGRVSDLIQRVSFLFVATANDHITQDRFSCSLIRYLIVSHLLLDGTFELPSNIVPNLSCIQFCMRAVGVQEAYNHALDADEAAEGLLSYYQTNLKEVLTEGHRYPFTTLREEMHLLSAMAHSETRLPSLLWNEDHTVLQVDGSPFIVASLRDMIRAQLARANELLESLCEGLDMKDYDACLKKHLDPKNATHWPRDPLRKQTDGYSFLSDTDNPFRAFQSDLMKQIVETPDIFEKYHQASIARWFAQLAELHDLTFCLVHITSGGPARGTELETYRLINTRESPRTLYFVSGHLAFITGYNKSRQLSNFPERFVARPVYPPIQRLIMYLAGPLHHIADIWISTLNNSTHSLGPEVFAHFGKPLRSEDFSRILHTQTAQHLLVPMGLRVWRQMIKALMRHVVNVDIDDDGDQEEDALDESFGHTTGTGRSRYGLTWNDLPHLHEDMLSDIFRVSKRFWDWLERPASAPSPPLQPDMSYSQIHAEMAATLSKLQLAATQQTSTIELSTSNQTLILDMLRSTNQKIDRNHRAVIEGRGIVSQSAVQDLEPIDIAFARTQALQSYMGESGSKFKSVQQASAVEVISRGLPHLLVVMPTGSGKSAIYACPGFAERQGFRVVIITYRSLLDQAVQDARTRGLAYSVYPSREVDLFHSRLVFVSLEHAAQPEFRTWCVANKKAGLLRCIVIDEVHDAILASYYRHAFNQMFKLTDLGVQMLLMTATLSPLSEETLLEFLRMDPSSVRKIRMPTNRPEIQYRVARSSKESIDTDVLSAALGFNLEQHERGIIFVLTTTCCDELAETSGFPKYHGKLTDAERTQYMLQWRSGKSQWIVGTLAMAQGIDIRHVRVVINREISWGMVDFVTLETCRRRNLSLFLDGIDQTCTSILNAQLCDICLSHSHILKNEQEFYSSPLGRRLKAPPAVEPMTPAAPKTKSMGLPTPITAHTSAHERHALPSSPTPFRQRIDEAALLSDNERHPPRHPIIRSEKAPAEQPDRRSAIQRQKAPADQSSDEESDPRPAQRTRFEPTGSALALPQGNIAAGGSTFAPPARPRATAPASVIPPRASGSSSARGDHVTASNLDPIPSSPTPALGDGLPTAREGKTKHILQWCELHYRKCSVCLFYSEDVEHFAYNCPKGTLRTPEYRTAYKGALRFKSFRVICFGCLIPYDVHKDQPTPRLNNPFSCLYDDHLRPIAYLIYINQPIRNIVFPTLGLRPNQFINVQAYTAWLSVEEPHVDALPNVLEIIIAYMNLKIMGRLPSVTLGA